MGDPWVAAAAAAALASVIRALLLLISSNPMFMSDSGAYLGPAHHFAIYPDRPIGLSVFYRALFEVAHDLRFVLLVQSGLGVVSSALGAVLAAQCGLGRRASFAAGAAVAASPTMLVYERVILAETLVVAMSLAAVSLLFSGLDNAVYGRMIAAGAVAGAIVSVRTNNSVTVMGCLIVILFATAPRLARRRRFGLALAFGAASAAAVGSYATVNYVDSAHRYGEGAFAVGHFEGLSLFARYARMTDCSDPAEPPAVRASVCAAGDEFLDRDMGDVIWRDGPVLEALTSPDVIELNQQYRELAIETMVAHPLTVATDSLRTAWTDLTGRDRRYYARATDNEFVSHVVGYYFGPEVAVRGDESFADAIQDVYAGYTLVRPLVWIGALGALATAMSRSQRSNRAGLIVAAGFFIPLCAVSVAGVDTPRYVAPLEPFALVGAIAFATLTVRPRVRGYVRRKRSSDRLPPSVHGRADVGA